MHNYTLMMMADLWKCPSMGGDELLDSRYVSSVPGKLRSNIDYTDRVVSWKPTGKFVVLDTGLAGDFVQIQDMYAVFNNEYDHLRDRYRREKKPVRALDRPMLVYIPVLLVLYYTLHCIQKIISVCQDAEWEPRHGPRLTDDEVNYLKMQPIVEEIQCATLNGVPFRTTLSQAKKQTKINDSVICNWYSDLDGRKRKSYGEITRLVVQSMFPGMCSY